MLPKRKKTQPRRAVRREKGGGGAAAGNRRRHPRARAQGSAAASESRSQRSSSREKIPPGGGTPRGKWLRTAARWGLRVGIAGGLSYAALFGVQEGYEFATTSPRFEARGLVFEPTPHVDDEALRDLMGIKPGTNILALEIDALAGRVSAHPWVRRATVTRELPDTLLVDVEEHEPQAVLLAGGFFLVGEDGVPFKPLEAGERGTLPIITGVDPSTMFAVPDEAKKQVSAALEVLRAYRAKRRPRLSEVHVDHTGAITLYTADLGSQLRLGREDTDGALARYDALRAALGEESDKLAVAHLDQTSIDRGRDRVVASFFPTQDVPGFVEEAATAAEERAREHAVAEQEREDAKRKKRKGHGHEKRSRLPRYE